MGRSLVSLRVCGDTLAGPFAVFAHLEGRSGDPGHHSWALSVRSRHSQLAMFKSPGSLDGARHSSMVTGVRFWVARGVIGKLPDPFAASFLGNLGPFHCDSQGQIMLFSHEPA